MGRMEARQRVYRWTTQTFSSELETGKQQGRMGSRRNGWIWRDDLDQIGHLLCWVVAEVSILDMFCN